MEQQLAQLWKVLMWGLGICVSGFLFLAGWCWVMLNKINKKVSHEWLENTFTKNLNHKFQDMNLKFDLLDTTMRQIRDAVCGDFDQRGIIQGIEDTKREIKDMKAKCKEIQESKK